MPASPKSGEKAAISIFSSDGPVAKGVPRWLACDLYAAKIERELIMMRPHPAAH
jgi:hypothetical protein